MPKLSPERLAARRQHIVDTARELFAERGFATTSMADLVTATGMSVGALYRYFPSKAALVGAVVEGRDGQRASETATPADGLHNARTGTSKGGRGGGFDEHESAGDLVGRLLGYVTDSPQARTHARLVTQVWAEAALSPDVAALTRQRHAALRDHLAATLTSEGAEGGEQITAEVVLAALIGVATLAAVDHDMDLAAIGRALHRLVTNSEHSARE